MIKNILFDFWWVMISNIEWWGQYIEEKHNLKEWYIYDKIKYVVLDYAKWLINTFDFRKWLIDNLGKDLWEEVFEHWWYRGNISINYNMIDFVLRLKDIWYNCYLLSDTNEIHKSANEMKHIYDIFDELILSCDIWICKKEDWWNNTIKFFDYAIDNLNIKPEESIFIDDLEENCQTANRAGIKTILAKNSEQVIQDLSGILGID
jgi:putative hydrolase of the HAD superfamily